jgi:hypothetical protein
MRRIGKKFQGEDESDVLYESIGKEKNEIDPEIGKVGKSIFLIVYVSSPDLKNGQ